MTAAVFDREELLDRLGGDGEVLAEVVRLFLEDCPARLAALQAAVSARHAEGIRAAAHALKGAAGNLSAGRVSAAAAALEEIGIDARLDLVEAAWRRVSDETGQLTAVLRQVDIFHEDV
jgi:two-component system, sensor histidine kinase and response regulator